MGIYSNTTPEQQANQARQLNRISPAGDGSARRVSYVFEATDRLSSITNALEGIMEQLCTKVSSVSVPRPADGTSAQTPPRPGSLLACNLNELGDKLEKVLYRLNDLASSIDL